MDLQGTQLAGDRARQAKASVAELLEDFECACLIGSTTDIDARAIRFLMHATDMLKTVQHQAEAILEFWGIDPATRPQ